MYVLSHPPGEPESFSRLLSYPCLLGTCKTRPETAGVLLCMCWLSSPFRAAQNPTKNACKLLAFERRRAGSLCALCAFFVAGSVRPGFVTASNVTACRAAAGKLARIDCVLTAFEPAALREQIAHVTPHHARPAPLWDVLGPSIGFCVSRGVCARPGAS